MLLHDFGKAVQEQFLREAELNRAFSGRTARHARENQSHLLQGVGHLMARIGKLLSSWGSKLKERHEISSIARREV
jgi:hypothetical protein